MAFEPIVTVCMVCGIVTGCYTDKGKRYCHTCVDKDCPVYTDNISHGYCVRHFNEAMNSIERRRYARN